MRCLPLQLRLADIYELLERRASGESARENPRRVDERIREGLVDSVSKIRQSFADVFVADGVGFEGTGC